MTIKILRLLQLLAYFLVASQAVFYLVVFSDALKLSTIENFLENRRAIENLVAYRYRIIYFTCLVFSILTVLAAARNPGSVFFISSCIALVCVIADVLIALKLSIPLNQLISSDSSLTLAEWESIRVQWLDYFRYRGAFCAIGFLSLLVSLIAESK